MLDAPRWHGWLSLFVLVLTVSGVTVRSHAYKDTGAAVYRMTVEAREHLRAQRWSQAAAIYERLVRDNPESGAIWEGLGSSLHALGREREAVEAFERCMDLGFRPLACMYNICCCYSQQGDVEKAIDWLERAYAEGFIDEHLVHTDTDLDPLRSDPRFKRITGMADDAITDRSQRWRCDIDYLVRRLEEIHFNLHRVLRKSAFDESVSALRHDIEKLDDNGVRWRIQALLASIGDGHTAVVSERFMAMHGHGPRVVRVFALEPWWYDDGVYINECPDEYARVAGARIAKVGGIPIEEALRRIDTVVSRDNVWGAKWIAMETLRSPSAMQALGLAKQGEGLDLEVALPNGAFAHVTLPVVSLAELEAVVSKRNELKRLPLYRRKPDVHYWSEKLGSIVYVAFNAVHDSGNLTIREFSDSLFAMIDREHVEYLIIDIRNNHGGSGHLAYPLLHDIIANRAINQHGQLFVITGRETFSAAMAFASWLSVHTGAIFVGEPTGSRPNFVGESSLFVLPYSKLWISCSSRYHQGTESNDKRLWIAPDLPAPITPDAYRSNRDPALEAIMDLIGQSDSERGEAGLMHGPARAGGR